MYIMISRWYKSKESALAMRRQGISMTKVEHEFGIPRSTLSGWFRKINLTKKQKEILAANSQKGLDTARMQAVLWHNAQKKARLEKAKKEAEDSLKEIDVSNLNILELALSFLYLGEGMKKGVGTGMGNSDLKILKFFITALKKMYGVPICDFKCSLHLRADQNPEKMKRYWSKNLKIPLANFTGVAMDQRTAGRKTYPDYKGVCVITCGHVAIQRKLLYLGEMYHDKVIGMGS